jgi:alpha-N-arabinofuranosidase
VFLGTRPYAPDTYNTGRETFMLPVRWVDDWPVILSDRDTVPYVVKAPLEPRMLTGTVRQSGGRNAESPTGNFTLRDEFNDTALPLYWQTIRHPAGDWLDLTSSPGSLTLRARPAGFESTARPSFVGRRQQHLNATVTTALRYAPQRVGDKAGLVAFQNDEFYYFLAVARTDSGVVVQVERHGSRRGGAGNERILAARRIEHAPDAPVFLRIQARGGSYDFSFADRQDNWITLVADADGTMLSTKIAGGFVGSMLGVYAYSASDH